MDAAKTPVPLAGGNRGMLKSGNVDGKKFYATSPATSTSPRLVRQVNHLHRLGPKPIFEALTLVADGGDVDEVLADFARLDAEVIYAAGGDHFAPFPPVEVPTR
jgi:hypothetical protein